MDFDEALSAIVAIDALWREHGGQLTLADLGVDAALPTVWSRGQAAQIPERWRLYPGSATVRHERV